MMITSKPFKNITLSALVLLISGSLTSCYYDNEEELYANVGCKTGAMFYAADVVPVLAANCYSCHSIANAPISGDGITLEGYANINDFITDGDGGTRMIDAIEHNGDSPKMPKDGTKLDACSISMIKGWIEQGHLNN